MKKMLILIVIMCGLFLTGCDSSKKISESDTITNLNTILKQCSEEASEAYECKRNDDLQTYFKTYSDYRILNVSQKEFTAKPQEDNSLLTYGQETDMLCNYKYVLIYNEKTEQAFSVEIKCENNGSLAQLKNAKEIK